MVATMGTLGKARLQESKNLVELDIQDGLVHAMRVPLPRPEVIYGDLPLPMLWPWLSAVHELQTIERKTSCIMHHAGSGILRRWQPAGPGQRSRTSRAA
jgi:hypothetical protein